MFFSSPIWRANDLKGDSKGINLSISTVINTVIVVGIGGNVAKFTYGNEKTNAVILFLSLVLA